MPSVRFAVQSNHASLLPALLFTRLIQRREGQAAIEIDFQDSPHLDTPGTHLEFQVGEKNPIRNAHVVPRLLQEYNLIDSYEGPVFSEMISRRIVPNELISLLDLEMATAHSFRRRNRSHSDRFQTPRDINAGFEYASHAPIVRGGVLAKHG